MKYIAKLSKRLALAYGALIGAAVIGACADGSLTEPTSPSDSLSSDPPAVASISVSPDAYNVAIGGTIQFDAVLRDSAGNELAGEADAWTSTDSDVASVDATGLASAIAPGTTLITASSGSVSDTATLTVSAETGEEPHAGYYAAPDGSADGDGSADEPWNLAFALDGGGGQVDPGDTIWLRGGTYDGPFTSHLTGSAGAPIVVRQYPGERAVIDGAGTSSSTFVVHGDWSVFWGFELTNSDPVRTTDRPNTVVNYASHTKYIHLVVHDGSVGFYTGPDETDVEIVGCIVYNIGWQGTDRGHGHALYLKSYAGPVVARDNVLFNQFGYGVHVYTNAGSGELINIHLDGNIAFNNGTLSSNSTSANILLGGDDYADDDALIGNITYMSPGVEGTNVHVGYGSLANGDVELDGNTFVGGDPVLRLGLWDGISLGDNTLVGDERIIELNDNTLGAYAWGENRQYRDPLSTSWSFLGATHPWLTWQAATGLGASDLVTGGLPAEPVVALRASPYEPGRAVIAVYNPTGLGAVTVNMSGVLEAGDAYEVRNVQDLFGAPIASGTFDGGALTLPLAEVTPPVPVGMSQSTAPSTGVEFHVFIVRKL